ncbi:MAG: hypothetical protein ACKOCW_04060 [Planctomycetaceae bacterium]
MCVAMTQSRSGMGTSGMAWSVSAATRLLSELVPCVVPIAILLSSIAIV